MSASFSLTVDAQPFLADLEELAAIGRTADGGVERVAYGPADRAGREWVKSRLETLGLSWRDDSAGNTIGRCAGRQDDLPSLGIGSHTDTVPRGGAYDGALGVVASLAVARSLVSSGHRLRRPLEIINFAAEEATMAGGTTGSQAMTGRFNPAILDKKAWDGRPVRAHLFNYGLDPERLNDAARPRGSLAAFVELHIEQGTRLEQSQAAIGIVDGFVGIRRYAVSFPGRANHAGTTPLAERDDALLKAAPYVEWVRQVAASHGIVGTVGDFRVLPGAPNVIPGRVDLIVEIRGLVAGVLDEAAGELRQHAAERGASFEPVVEKPPVNAHPTVVEALTAACRELGLRSQRLTSGAGHDAMVMDAICPQGIFFVPSAGGISHAPDEYTSPEDCLNGAQLLLQTVLLLDETL